jgi:hypothetical protein
MDFHSEREDPVPLVCREVEVDRFTTDDVYFRRYQNFRLARHGIELHRDVKAK